MSSDHKDQVVEISKSLIGCLGGVAAACVTGTFALLAVFGPRIPIVNPSPAAVTIVVMTPAATSIALATSTPMPLPTATPVPTSLPPTATLAPTPAASGHFGPIIFAANFTSDKRPIDQGTTFPEGTTHVEALFDFAGMTSGETWREEWYWNSQLQQKLSGDRTWDLGAVGRRGTGIKDASGLAVGEWELVLYLHGELVQRASFTIDTRPAGAAYFGPLHFAEGLTNDQPVGPHEPDQDFKAGTTIVYGFCDVANMKSGLPYRTEWYRDGQLLTNLVKESNWNLAENETNYWVNIYDDNGLTPGTYEVKLYINGSLSEMGTFVVDK